jgi:hypothetical protein
MTAFIGFPPGAADWFESMLGETDWDQVRARAGEHEANVRGPMTALCADLADDFGRAFVWHLHRDPRLWNHQVATVPLVDNISLRVMLSLDALFVAGEWVTTSGDQVERYRAALLAPDGVARPSSTACAPTGSR